jgi:hypothetical protein
MKKNILILILTVGILNCFPNGRSPRQECKNGDGVNTTGRKSSRDSSCFLTLLLASKVNQTQGNFDGALIACLMDQTQLSKCDDRTTLPISIGSIK